MSAPRYIDADVKRLAKLNKTNKEIADILKVNLASVYRSKRRQNIKIKKTPVPPNPIVVQRTNRVLELLGQGLSRNIVGKRVGLSRQRIHQIIQDAEKTNDTRAESSKHQSL